jgi:transposase
MPRFKPYDYSQLQMVPVALDEQLLPGTLEFAIHYLVEQRLDLSIFDARYANDDTGCRAYDPKVLLKVILLGYARGLLSSRRLERVCRENIVFMALTCGQAPDHSTLAAFVSSMQAEVPALFAQVLLVCEQEGLLGGTHFSLDGLKLPANVSKECSGTFAELRYKQHKLEAKVREALAEHRQTDRAEDADSETERQRRERRLARLRRQAQRIEKFLATHTPRAGVRGQEIKSNVTDNESAYLKSSHGLMQGYNAQALVDAQHQVVTAAEATGVAQDFQQLLEVLPAAQQTAQAAGLGADYYRGKMLSADSNYHSERNLLAAEAAQLDAYIPDTHFRQRDVRFATQRRHRPRQRSGQRLRVEDFRYDAQRDHYICPQGQHLTLKAARHRSGTGWARRYKSTRAKCAGCPVAAQCLQRNAAARNLLIPLAGPPATRAATASRRMVAKIDTERGRQLYQRRLAIVEPVFANLRAHKGLHRFTLRGRAKVDIQWKLYCVVHNIGKLMHYATALN